MAEGDGSRNFRSAYYEKLGFCGNDEKDYLDMLIASSSLEPDKLTDLWTEKSGELDRKVVEALKVLLLSIRLSISVVSRADNNADKPIENYL